MHVPLKQELDAREDNGNLKCYWTPMVSQLTLTLMLFSEQLMMLHSAAHSAEVSHAIYKPWSCQRHMHRSDRASIQCHLKYPMLFHLA